MTHTQEPMAVKIQRTLKEFIASVEEKFSHVKKLESRADKCWMYIEGLTLDQLKETLHGFTDEHLFYIKRRSDNHFLNLAMTRMAQSTFE